MERSLWTKSSSDRRRFHERESHSLGSKIVSAVTYPPRALSRAASARLPFTKKSSVVLIKGSPCVESESSVASLTVVKFREAVSPADAEAQRFYLLVSHGDPWAHRALLAHALAGLESVVPVVASDGMWPLIKGLPAVATKGWRFSQRGQLRGGIFHSCSQELKKAASRGTVYLHEFYSASDPQATGRVTIPILWDSFAGRVVNNDSSNIVRILHEDLRRIGMTGIDLYPEVMREEIDRVKLIVYRFSAGVYKCGIAGSREGYERGLSETFAALRECERLLETRPFLAGDQITECDVFAFPTLVRFDAAYYTAFRCNKKRLRDFKNLSGYLERMYALPEVRGTVHMTTYTCVAFIEARWRGRYIGNLLRLFESVVDVLTGAAAPGAVWWKRAIARTVTLPARMLQRVFR